MRNYFGTDGIRGEANRDPMSAELALRLGRIVARRMRHGEHRPRVLIGRDTRISGDMLEAALVAGITSGGADAVVLGAIPTPGIAFLTTSMRADAGIVISASHNPYGDNGLKIFGRDGFKLPDAVEAELEAALERGDDAPLPTGHDIGRVVRVPDANGRYITHLKAKLQRSQTLEGLRIVVDCANGAASSAAPTLLWELGADVIPLAASPDGTNINEDCGSLHPEHAARAVLEHRAHIGIALDGDADRVILIDDEGHVVDGDAVLGMCALEMKRTGALARDTVVATVMSNMGLERALSDAGIRMERTAVGDRYVVQRLREGGFNFGGEQSGHLIFLDHASTGDGLLAALQVLNVMLARNQPLSRISRVIDRWPQVLLNRRVAAKPRIDDLPSVSAAIRNAEADLGRDGRVLVRYSGTEYKVRVMVEGIDADRIRAHAETILDAFRIDPGFAE